MGHLQSKAINCAIIPHVCAIGEGLRGKRSKFRYDHKYAAGCCISSLCDTQGTGALDTATTHACVACARVWQLERGGWLMPARIADPARRPLEKLRHVREAAAERLVRSIGKREQGIRSVLGKGLGG